MILSVPPVEIIIFTQRLFVLKVRTDGNMCERNNHYRPGLWVGRVDKYKKFKYSL